MPSVVNQWIRDHGLSGSTLKLIAIITMLIDHTGAVLVLAVRRLPAVRADQATLQFYTQLYTYMRRIGRLAFPIFCFLLIEGFLHTRDVRKYAGRLFLFALISEYPFDFALRHGQPFMNKQNVYFTLLIGLLTIWAVRELSGRIPLQLLVLAAGLLGAKLLDTDYSYRGVFLIETLYILRFSRFFQCAGGAAFMEYEKFPTPLAFVPVFLYNGKRGLRLKYVFYWFYPVHLMLLGILTYYVLPAVT